MAVRRALESARPPSSRVFSDRRVVSRGWRLVVAASRLGLVRRAVEALYDPVAGPGPRGWPLGPRRRGEPWTFGLDPAEAAEFLARRGLGLIGDLCTADAGER